jgi:hypothetical protein
MLTDSIGQKKNAYDYRSNVEEVHHLVFDMPFECVKMRHRFFPFYTYRDDTFLKDLNMLYESLVLSPTKT